MAQWLGALDALSSRGRLPQILALMCTYPNAPTRLDIKINLLKRQRDREKFPSS